jgi:hypothetical protein
MRPRMMRNIWIFCLLMTAGAMAATDISFMAFNIWHAGTSVANGQTKIRNALVAANADVIGFSEVENTNGDWTTKMRDSLAAVGKTYYRGYVSGDVSLLSKYPITSSAMISGQTQVARFLLDVNGSPVTVIVGHLDYQWYACYLPRGYNGSSPDWNMIDDGAGNPAPVTNVSQILSYNLSSGRDESVRAILTYVRTRTEPIVLLGDFNEPSHRDWTSRTKDMFDHHGIVVPWQTTKVLEDSGFVDAYRQIFPDEVLNPGFTWPSYAHGVASTSWTPKADERDRIDFIFHKGAGITAQFAALVGPKASYVVNVSNTANTANEIFLGDSLPWP